MDKIKDSLGSVMDKIQVFGTDLGKLIKENNDILNAHHKLAKESSEGINSLKTYAETESEGIKNAITSLAEAFESIESNREGMVEQLRDKFIAPFEELVEHWKGLNTELKEESSAEKQVEKCKKDLAKKQAKNPAKLKPNEVEDAASKLKNAIDDKEKKHEQAVKATEQFNEQKNITLKEVLQDIVNIQTEFHKSALDSIKTVEEKIKEMDSELETES